MGKYMRKGKGVGKMEVSQGTLVGVRTRAKSLAMEKEKVVGSLSLLHHSFSTSATTASSSKASGSSSHALSTQPLYMELRSRKLEKGIRSGKDKGIDQTFDMPELCKKTKFGFKQGAAVCKAATLQARTENRPLGILTRNRRQELACSSALNSEAAVDMDAFLLSQNLADPRNKRHIEVEVCCGESPIGADACDKARECEPSSTKRARECTPDSFIRDTEAPGSTSKARPSIQARPLPAPAVVSSCEAPNANEIEAFLSSAEQRERRRFINRFNFDPLLERPLR
ncbi:hypothetical protein GOP47_0002772, partial [Adiantum capillus-veneris]